MKRLSGIDTAFLYGETPSWHMHVCSLMIVEPPNGAAFDIDRLRHDLGQRLPLVPQFRWKLVEVPFHIDRPGWIEDADFDLDYHVRHIAVPAPGGEAELNKVVGDLASHQLDRSRPLWELWVIDGLAGGQAGVFAKMHHSTIDGSSGMGLAEVLLDLEPDPPPREIDAKDTLPTEAPPPLTLVAKGMLNYALTPIRFTRLASQVIRQGVEIARFGRGGRRMPPLGLGAPRTSLNGDIGPYRSFASTSVSLDDVKAVKDAFGVKLNDVVLALCSTALRDHLLANDELPETPLIAQVPVSLRTESDKDEVGTKVGNMFASLATNVEGPVERLLDIHESTTSAKEMRQAMSVHRIMGISDAAPPRLISLAARMYSLAQLDRNAPPPMNVIVSNVPGPTIDLYMMGSKVKSLFPMGPLLYGNRVEITVVSIAGSLDFGILACRETAPDPKVFADRIGPALAELVTAAKKRTAKPAKQKAAPKKKQSAPKKKTSTKKKAATKES